MLDLKNKRKELLSKIIYGGFFFLLMFSSLFLSDLVYAENSDIFSILQVKNETQGNTYAQTTNANPGDVVVFDLKVSNESLVEAENVQVEFIPVVLTGSLLYPAPDKSEYAYHTNNAGGGIAGYILLSDLDLDGSSGGDNQYLMTTSLPGGAFDKITYVYVKIPENYNQESFSITVNTSCDNGCSDVSNGLNTATVFVNTKPQILEAVFLPSSIPQDGVTPTYLQAIVNDPNSPDNIVSVTVDLTSLGGSGAVILYDDGLHNDGLAGDSIFKSSAIVVNKTLATGEYSNLTLTVRDVDGFENSVTTSLTVQEESVFTVVINSIDQQFLSEEEGYNQAIINWQTNQDCGSLETQGFQIETSTGAVLIPWTQWCVANTPVETIITKEELLEGENNFVLKLLNDKGTTSTDFILNLDLVEPIITVNDYSSLVYGQDAYIKWIVDEKVSYVVKVWGIEVTGNNTHGVYTDYNVTNGEILYTVIKNTDLFFGNNQIYIYTTDQAGNTNSQKVVITKQIKPILSGVTNLTLEDTDTVLENGLNGLDVTISWDKPTATTTINNFLQYEIYLLPEGINLNINNHIPIVVLDDINVENWTGDNMLTTTSDGLALASGNYKAYVRVISRNSDNYSNSDSMSSSSAVLTEETPVPPAFVSAVFVSDTTLAITFSRELKTDWTSHNAKLVTSTDFSIDQTRGDNGVLSVSGATILLAVNSLNNTGKTTADLDIAAGAVVSVSDALNLKTLNQLVTDGQNPIVSFTVPGDDSFLNADLNVQYQITEKAQEGGVKMVFNRIGGEEDVNSPQTVVFSGEEANTSYSFNLNANNFISEENGTGSTLVNGAEYSTTMRVTDLAGNLSEAVVHTGHYFDNESPTTPVTVHFPDPIGNNNQYTQDITPKLNWFSARDNLTNENDLGYTLELSMLNDFSVIQQSFSNIFMPVVDTSNDEYALFLRNGLIDENGGSFYIAMKIPEGEKIKKIRIPFIQFDSSLIDIQLSWVSAVDPVVATWTDPSLSEGCSFFEYGSSKYLEIKTARFGLEDQAYLLGNGTVKDIFKIDFTVKEGVDFPINIIARNTSAEIVNELGLNKMTSFNWYQDLQLIKVVTATFNNNIFTPVVDTSNDEYALFLKNGLIDENGGSFYIAMKIPEGEKIKKIRIPFIQFDSSLIDIQLSWVSAVDPVVATWTDPSLSEGCSFFEYGSSKYLEIKTARFGLEDQAYLLGDGTVKDIFKIDFTVKEGVDFPINIIARNTSAEIVNELGLNKMTSFNWYQNLQLIKEVVLNANSQELFTLVTEGVYYWRVRAVDEAGNRSVDQNPIERFILDKTAPIVSIINLIDSTLNSLTYTKNTDSVLLSAIIEDSNKIDMSENNITANLSWLGWEVSVNPLSYNLETGLATWSGTTVVCAEGETIIVPIQAVDSAGNVVIDNSASLICDNTDPVVGVNTLAYPNGGQYWAGASTQYIVWNDNTIIETNLKGVDLEYFDGSNWQMIASNESNDGIYQWNQIPSLNTDNVKIRLTAIDGVGGTASDTSDANFTIDSLLPTITTETVTYPNGGEFLKGGATATITWDSSDITDLNLKATPIKLEYFDGSNWQLIAENISNNGSYLWDSVPSLDIDNALVRLTAVDKAINYDLDDSNASFTIDSTPPIINVREVLDLNGNGLLDAVKIELNENIKDSTIDLTDFSLDQNYTWNNFSGGLGTISFVNGVGTVTTNDNIFYLAITEGSGDSAEVVNCSDLSVTGCDTEQTPTLQYTAGSLTDRAGNNLASDTGVITIDKASPVAKYGQYLDINNDGQIDRVDFYFSENIINDGYNDNDYVVTKAGTINLNNETGVIVNNERLQINIEGDSQITGGEQNPEISYVNNFITSSRGLKDSNNNGVASFSLSLIDKAVPIFWAETWIALVTPALKISFSENIDSISDSFAVWTLTDGFNVTAVDTLDGTTNFALLSVDQNFIDTSLTPDVTYTAGDIVDAFGNVLITKTVTATDKLRPYLNNIKIEDSNKNGSIDLARLDFSEAIDVATVNLDDYTIGGIIPTAKNISGNQLELTIANEIRETKAVEVVYTGSTTADSWGNVIETIEAVDFVEIDSAWPVILSAFYIEGASVEDDELIVVFSEEIDDSSVEITDFIVTGSGAIANSEIDNQVVNDNRIIIKLNVGDSRLVAGVSTIAFSSAGVVSDNIDDNDGQTTNTQTNGVVVNGAIIINEVMWAGSTASGSDEYLELRNLGSTAVDISGWMIENAGSTGSSLTIPAGQIMAGNGYYLIANYDENSTSSVLNITPDWVTASISLTNTGNGDLVLKDNIWTILDSAKGDTWPAGEATNKYSMERKEDIGSGLLEDSWYTAVENTNLDAGIEKGTPRADNVFDNLPPEIETASRSPEVNSLLPMATPTISADYAEKVGGVGVDINSVKIEVDLNQDNDFDDEVLLGGVTYRESPDIASLNPVFCNNGGNLTVTETQAQCTPPTNLPVGKNLVKITVGDLANNESSNSWNFWVDSLMMTVTEQNVAKMSISAGSSSEVNDSTKITIQTYGAGLDLSAVFAQLTTGSQKIDFTEYNYDVRVAGSVIQDYDGYSNASASESVWNIAKETDLVNNPNLKTYEIYIKYQVSVDAIQIAGNYGGKVNYGLNVIY